VNSDAQITVISPPSTGPGLVDFTVTTPAGTSATSPADQFTYTARIASSGGSKSCVVPKLKGKKLKAVKRLLLMAECKLGKVKGQKSKSAKVKKQSAKPGTVVAAGSKVNVTLK
jgi:PASTA domain